MFSSDVEGRAIYMKLEGLSEVPGISVLVHVAVYIDGKILADRTG